MPREDTGLSEAEIQESQQFFKSCIQRRPDAVRVRSGQLALTVEELDIVLRRLRLFVPVRFIWALVLEIDDKGDGEVELDEFLMMVAKLRGRAAFHPDFYLRSLSRSAKEKYTRVFNILDSDNDGFMDEEGVCRAMKQLNPQMNSESDNLRQYLEELRSSVGNSGNISVKDFLILQSKIQNQPTEMAAALICLTEHEHAYFTQVFQEWKATGSGSNTLLRETFAKLGYQVTNQHIRHFLSQLNSDGGIKTIEQEHFLYILVSLGAGTSQQTRRILRPRASYEEAFQLGFTLEELWELGYDDLEKIRRAGYGPKVLITAGYAEAYQLRQVGYSASELRKIGCTAKQLKVAGFSLEDLRNAGFSSEVLRECISILSKHRPVEGAATTLRLANEYDKAKTSAAHGEMRWWNTPRIQAMLDGPRVPQGAGARGGFAGPRASTAP